MGSRESKAENGTFFKDNSVQPRFVELSVVLGEVKAILTHYGYGANKDTSSLKQGECTSKLIFPHLLTGRQTLALYRAPQPERRPAGSLPRARPRTAQRALRDSPGKCSSPGTV